ncbi:MAG: hypothetical protein AB7S38_28865 [Vulcanimicrobiota bacterium]
MVAITSGNLEPESARIARLKGHVWFESEDGTEQWVECPASLAQVCYCPDCDSITTYCINLAEAFAPTKVRVCPYWTPAKWRQLHESVSRLGHKCVLLCFRKVGQQRAQEPLGGVVPELTTQASAESPQIDPDPLSGDQADPDGGAR